MRDQVEVEDLISLHFNNGSVNDCAVTRIQAVLVLLHKQAVLDVAVNQAVKNLRLVSWGGVFKKVGNDLHLKLLHLRCH